MALKGGRNMKEIILTQGQVAQVDDEDYDRVNRFSWCAIKSKNTWYARTVLRLPDGTTLVCPLQNAILEVTPSRQIIVDHKNGDGRNCQKENLRILSARQNAQNKHGNYTSELPGVSAHKVGTKGNYHNSGKWIAHIKIDGKVKHLGIFKTEEEAYQAYCHAVSLCGVKALTNKGGK
jgi:hypothetical protein